MTWYWSFCLLLQTNGFSTLLKVCFHLSRRGTLSNSKRRSISFVSKLKPVLSHDAHPAGPEAPLLCNGISRDGRGIKCHMDLNAVCIFRSHFWGFVPLYCLERLRRQTGSGHAAFFAFCVTPTMFHCFLWQIVWMQMDPIDRQWNISVTFYRKWKDRTKPSQPSMCVHVYVAHTFYIFSPIFLKG